jgi:membrane-associated protease RseP (regulator of RpoE activity)
MTNRRPVAFLGLVLLALSLPLAAPKSARADDTPWLGVTLQELNDGLRDGMGYDGDGVLVNQVLTDSPADRAGLRSGDVIVRFNGRTATSPDQLTQLVRDSRVGQNVSITVMRNGDRRTLSAHLASRPDDQDMPAPQARSKTDRDDDQGDMDHGDMKTMGDLKALKQMRGMEGMEGMPPGMMMMGMGMGRGRLGVRTQDLSDDLSSYFEAPPGSGALVLEVLKDSPAERAGIKAGDVIVRVGDTKISGPDELANATRSAPEGSISLTVLRHGSKRTLEADLPAAPRMDSRNGFGPNRRMIIHDQNGTRVYGGNPGGGSGSQDEELQQLRDEVRRLRQELKEQDKQNNNDDGN